MGSGAPTHTERPADAHRPSRECTLVLTPTKAAAPLLPPLLGHTFTPEDLAEAWRGVGGMERSLHRLQ